MGLMLRTGFDRLSLSGRGSKTKYPLRLSLSKPPRCPSLLLAP